MLFATADSSFATWVLVALPACAALIAVHLGMLASCTCKPEKARRLRWYEWMLYVGFLGVVLALAATSFASILIWGVMSQWSLLIHLGAAGAFVFLLLAVTVIWAPQAASIGPMQADDSGEADPFWWLSKCSFWMMVVAGIVTACSMLVGMLPVFSTNQLLASVNVHRYAGLAVVVAAIFHCYSIMVRARCMR